MSRPLQWEFPGGKIREGESAEDCIAREIREELGLSVRPVARLDEHVYTYADKTVCLVPFACRIDGGTLTLMEHNDARWLTPMEFDGLDWCSADRPIAELLQNGARHALSSR
jgi:8-oxo-dGTP diphosphatase